MTRRDIELTVRIHHREIMDALGKIQRRDLDDMTRFLEELLKLSENRWLLLRRESAPPMREPRSGKYGGIVLVVQPDRPPRRPTFLNDGHHVRRVAIRAAGGHSSHISRVIYHHLNDLRRQLDGEMLENPVVACIA